MASSYDLEADFEYSLLYIVRKKLENGRSFVRDWCERNSTSELFDLVCTESLTSIGHYCSVKCAGESVDFVTKKDLIKERELQSALVKLLQQENPTA